MEFEHMREAHVERATGQSSGRGGGGERRPPTTIQWDRIINRSLLPSYTDIAQRLTEGGFGTFSVVESEKQVTGDGRPLDNPHFVAATFKGQEDWEYFRDATIEVNRLLDSTTGSKTEEEVGAEAVEEAKQKGIECVASKVRIRNYVISSVLNRPKEV